MGTVLVCVAPHAVVCGVHVRSVEDCNMAGLKIYSDQLYSEYRELKAQMEREVNAFELLRKQHNKKISDTADLLTRKYFEYQRAKQEGL